VGENGVGGRLFELNTYFLTPSGTTNFSYLFGAFDILP
jgi:hypothetical protein